MIGIRLSILLALGVVDMPVVVSVSVDVVVDVMLFLCIFVVLFVYDLNLV